MTNDDLVRLVDTMAERANAGMMKSFDDKYGREQ